MKNPFGKSARARLAEVEREVETLILATEKAADGAANAVEKRRLAVDAPDEELDRLDAAVERAATLHRRAAERLEAGRARLDEATAAAQAEVAAERAKKAAALRAKIEPTIASTYAEAARAVLGLLKSIATANAELVELGDTSGSVEIAGRGRAWLKKTVVGERVVTLWADRYGSPLPEQPQDREVHKDRNGHFLVRHSGVERFNLWVWQEDFREISYKEDALGRYDLASLASELVLPPVADGAVRIWPPRDGVRSRTAKLLGQIDHALAEIDRQLVALRERRDDRPVLTRLERVPKPAGAAPEGDKRDLAAIARALEQAAAGAPMVEPVRRGSLVPATRRGEGEATT